MENAGSRLILIILFVKKIPFAIVDSLGRIVTLYGQLLSLFMHLERRFLIFSKIEDDLSVLLIDFLLLMISNIFSDQYFDLMLQHRKGDSRRIE